MTIKFAHSDMKCRFGSHAGVTFFLLFFSIAAFTQSTTVIVDSAQPGYRTVIAGRQYYRSGLHHWLFGKHYRKEWATPVRIKVFNLDSVAGGLTATEQGGGRQSKTLRLRGANGKEYVLRSIDKTFGKALPEIVQGTLIEDVIDDQVSIAHPYSAITVPLMADAAGIYHTIPDIVFVPAHPRLGEFNTTFANMLCLFEERPDDNQEDAPHFGNSKNVVGTPKMFEKVFDDNDDQVDQPFYIRARLFDMMIGDWGRHEDQWRWATFEDGKKKTYKAIPRDRDQLYTKFDGFVPWLVLTSPPLSHLESFDYKIKDVEKYNFPSRNLDRQLANEPSREVWVSIAKDIQQKVTDDIIERSVKQLPPEVFKISGDVIIAKIKSRRDRLVDYANQYYEFLANEVDIAGSDKTELFEVNRINDNETSVNVYKISKEGEVKNKPVYSRVFYKNETDEIRLYGLKNDDVFHINGSTDEGIKIRIIPGPGDDSVVDRSSVKSGGKKTKVYDTNGKNFQTSGETKVFISSDTALNNFQYATFKYGAKGLNYKLPIGVSFIYRKQKWRKEPYGFEHRITLKYAVFRNGFYVDYTGLYPQLIGRWDLAFNAGFDAPNVENYFGIGNETQLPPRPRSYNRTRSTEIRGGFAFNRPIGKVQNISIGGFYESVKINANTGKFVSGITAGVDPSVFNRKHFGGGLIYYHLRSVNSDVLATKGVDFQIGSSYTRNLKSDTSFFRHSSSFSFYIPLGKKLSFASRIGGAVIEGDPEFYQLNKLGTSDYLRGFRQQRFYGEKAFYNNNELRFIFNTKNYLFNGKMGILAFFDNGRVWQPGEKSDKWHYGYGGGLIISPFNRITFSGYFGVSEESKVVDAKVGLFF